jgi:hypothetical protein
MVVELECAPLQRERERCLALTPQQRGPGGQTGRVICLRCASYLFVRWLLMFGGIHDLLGRQPGKFAGRTL